MVVAYNMRRLMNLNDKKEFKKYLQGLAQLRFVKKAHIAFYICNISQRKNQKSSKYFQKQAAWEWE